MYILGLATARQPGITWMRKSLAGAFAWHSLRPAMI